MGTMDRRLGTQTSKRGGGTISALWVISAFALGALAATASITWFVPELRPDPGVPTVVFQTAMVTVGWLSFFVISRCLLLPITRYLERIEQTLGQSLGEVHQDLRALREAVPGQGLMGLGQAGLDELRRLSGGPPRSRGREAEHSSELSGAPEVRWDTEERRDANVYSPGETEGQEGPQNMSWDLAPEAPEVAPPASSQLPIGRLMEAWDNYRGGGDGSFRSHGYRDYLERLGVAVKVWPGSELELGNAVLAAGLSLQGELVLVPSFNKAPRELEAWFDSDVGPRSPRVQRWHRPARVYWKDGRVELIERGNVG